MADRPPPDRLAEALRHILERRAATQPPARSDLPARLDALERDVQETRTRVNALFFAVIAVAIADLIGRVVLP